MLWVPITQRLLWFLIMRLDLCQGPKPFIAKGANVSRHVKFNFVPRVIWFLTRLKTGLKVHNRQLPQSREFTELLRSFFQKKKKKGTIFGSSAHIFSGKLISSTSCRIHIFSALFKVKSFLTCDVLLQKFDGVARIIFTTSFSQPLLHVLHSPLVDRLGPLSFNGLVILGSWATVTWFRTRFACFTVRISWMQWWQWRFHRHPEVSSLGSSWAKLLSFVVTHLDFTNFLTTTKILYFSFFCISFKQHCGNSSDNIWKEEERLPGGWGREQRKGQVQFYQGLW